jgi:prolyl-tRNA editing enzyme YbaK/EbsC (Cys-tRNA(Pro) deacylase)
VSEFAADPKVALVIEAGRALDIRVVPTRFPDGTRTAAAAAEAIGVSVAEIANSLVFLVDDDPVLVLSSGAERVDLAALAAASGGSEATRCPPDRVKEATGYAIGGVPPFGHRSALPVLLDDALLEFDRVWAAAGTADTCFPVTPIELVRATAARVVTVRVRG